MRSTLALFVAMILALSMQAQVVEYHYDFNSLELADLNGQDAWKTILHTSGPVDMFVEVSTGSVISPDGTKSVFYNGNGAGYGRTATRKATPNFNFDLTQAEVVEVEIDMHRNYWGMFFGVGYDADGDGHIAPGLSTEPNDGGILFNISSQNLANNKITLPNGNSIVFTAENESWCRYRMVLDFTANGGAGAVALSYNPGVSGEWIAIPEVQGINMGLTPGSGDKKDRAVWDGIFFHGQGGTAAFDNLLVRQMESLGGLQYIDFPALSNRLTTDPSFELEATVTSGLPIEYEVTQGPAAIEGNVVTLTGEAGFVTISANQPGNANWAPAPEVFQSFEVVDAAAYTPDLTIRRPADSTKVYMTELNPLLIVASVYIDHPEVLEIKEVSYEIVGLGVGDTLTRSPYKTGYFTAQWIPDDFATYTMIITASSTGGMISTQTISFEVSNNVSDLNVQAFEQVQISTSTSTSVTQDFVFPSWVGTFDQLTAYLDVTCPAGGCDPWDRVGSMEARGPNGVWIEIFRYITPYGVPCDHQIDVTDYGSIFQGLVEMRFSIGTDAQGFVVDVNFDFQQGIPQYNYSWVNTFWRGTFPFGDYANMQPMDTVQWHYDPGILASKLKVINTGHGWGNLNTGNAAEFYEATHKIKVENEEYDQHLWVDCNPNPDGCQPQSGTWYYDRAGWCPGSISHVYDYDLTSFAGASDVEIVYEFYPGYVDLCHPNHPDCVTGVTCSDCSAGFNPHYIISGNLVSYGNVLNIVVGEKETNYFGLEVFPNPTISEVHLTTFHNNQAIRAQVSILNHSGQMVDQFDWNGNNKTIDLSACSKGIYFIRVDDGNHSQTERIILK